MHAGRPFQADPLPAALRRGERGSARSAGLHGLPPMRPVVARRRSTPARPLAAVLLVLALAGVTAACSRALGPDTSLPASVLATLPAPPSASMTVGAQGPGVDGDAVFYAYTSPADPGAERSAYDTALRSAGFEPLQRSGVWTAYRRDTATVWVSVSADGPPTSIVALVATDPAAIGLPARLGTDPAPGGQLAAEPPAPPATPEPASRMSPGSPGTGGPGSPGSGSRGDPSASPSPVSSARPAASPPPDATAKPRPNDKPKPSHPAKATPNPKPTPRPTPKTRPSQAASPGATGA